MSQPFSRGRSAYQERAVLRASVTTADTVADRAATSIDTVPWLELDVAWLAGGATLSEMAIDLAVEDRPSFALGAVPAEVLVDEHLLGGISFTE